MIVLNDVVSVWMKKTLKITGRFSSLPISASLVYYLVDNHSLWFPPGKIVDPAFKSK